MTTTVTHPAKSHADEPSAAESLLVLLYDELHRLAQQRLSQEPPGQTLQATALVHEAYLRLVGNGSEEQRWANRAHFFAAAAETMRRILVENARRKNRNKHGGGRVRVDLDAALLATAGPNEDLLALDEALTRFVAVDPVAASLVQLRYFSGLTVAEAAEMLAISPRTADNLWAYARAWLYREIQGADNLSEKS